MFLWLMNGTQVFETRNLVTSEISAYKEMNQVDGSTNIFVEIVVSNAKDYGVAEDK